MFHNKFRKLSSSDCFPNEWTSKKRALPLSNGKNSLDFSVTDFQDFTNFEYAYLFLYSVNTGAFPSTSPDYVTSSSVI